MLFKNQRFVGKTLQSKAATEAPASRYLKKSLLSMPDITPPLP
jgi:hypothetical protein